MQSSNAKQDDISRRVLFGALAAAGITGSFASDLLGQEPPKLSVDVVRNASVILGEHFSEERLKIIEAALQHNLDEFQRVRDLKLDDLTEPAPAFISTRHDLPQALAGASGATDEHPGTGVK